MILETESEGLGSETGARLREAESAIEKGLNDDSLENDCVLGSKKSVFLARILSLGVYKLRPSYIRQTVFFLLENRRVLEYYYS